MFTRSKSSIYLVRICQHSFRWISKDTAAAPAAVINSIDLTQYISSTNGVKDTLTVHWSEWNEAHRTYLQAALQENENIIADRFMDISKGKGPQKKKRPPSSSSSSVTPECTIAIKHITVSHTKTLSNDDAMAMMDWLSSIMASPNNKIKGVSLDLSQSAHENAAVINEACIDKLCDGICANPNLHIDLESLEFHHIDLSSTRSLEFIFDTIKFKCRYVEYLSLAHCNVGEDVADVIARFYLSSDYYGLRNCSLSEIDLYGNRFAFAWLFHQHCLVAMNRNLKKFIRVAIKSYGDFLRVDSLLIHTDDPYFKLCLLPNLRMAIGTITPDYTYYSRETVRYNRRHWNDSTIKLIRKWVLTVCSAVTFGLLLSDFFIRGKRSWWFMVAEWLKLDWYKNNSRKRKKKKKKQKEAEQVAIAN